MADYPEREGGGERFRLRSFIERYVVARAPHFQVGREMEDAHNAMLDAKNLYKRINDVGRRETSETSNGGDKLSIDRVYQTLHQMMNRGALSSVDVTRIMKELQP